MGEIFINYRGEDSRSYGALLYLELSRRLGSDSVFLDSESIPAGSDYVDQLLQRVRHARALLAVIGPHWLTAADPTGRARINDPADWTRRELAEAFAAHVNVIPILTDDADLPAEANLPPELAPLSRRQYRRLRYRDASADITRIAHDLTATDPELATAQRQSVAPKPSTRRDRELAQLATIMNAAHQAARRTGAAAIAAIRRTHSISGTWAALQQSYQNVEQYPARLAGPHGFDHARQPAPFVAVMRSYLHDLRVAPWPIPNDPDTQTAPLCVPDRGAGPTTGRQALRIVSTWLQACARVGQWCEDEVLSGSESRRTQHDGRLERRDHPNAPDARPDSE